MTDYITFRSVTFAQQGERVLLGAGIRCVLRRTPRWMEAQGCGYCLRLSENRMEEALVLLRENGIAWQRIYHGRPDGTLEERTL